MTSSRRRAPVDRERDGWECRYFFPELPEFLAPARLSKRFPDASGPFDDNDVYVVADLATRNVKFRRRSSTIKLKEMLGREDDSFELWRTELESPLPAPAGVWSKVLSWVSIGADPGPFARCSSPDEAIEAMRREAADLRCVETFKRRSFYQASPGARIEVGRITIGATALSTIVFESRSLSEARALRGQFAGELAEPENYVGLISSIIPT